MPEEVRIRCGDGVELAGTIFAPSTGAPPLAAVVIAGAMGVHRRFYAPFAAYLAGRGIWTLSFDYRGIGGSAPRAPATLRGFSADVHSWGEQDLPAAIAFARAQVQQPLLLVGHSVGGQLVGLLPNWRELTAVLTVASQSGYWQLWPGMGRYAMWMLWHVGIPLFVGTLGYMPMKRFGQGEDLPAGVAREWARWGKHPKYVLSYAETRPANAFAELDLPLRAYAIADDRYAPRPTVERLFAEFQRARKELVVLTPSEAGAKTIGHFGFFRSPQQEKLWTPAADWLLKMASARVTSGP